MKDPLHERLARECALSAEESHWLDEALEGQSWVADAVSRLPEPGASLAWRSALEERLRGARAARPRVLARRWGLGFVAVALVALLAVTGDFAFDAAVPEPASIEEILVGAHRDAEVSVRVDWTDSLDDPALESL